MEAFRSYYETGNSNAKTMLKYAAFCSILSLSEINPFDSTEAKVYRDDIEMELMMKLRAAYENKEINTIYSILNKKEARIKDDEFLSGFLDDLKQVLSLELLNKTISLYQRVTYKYLCEELKLDAPTLEKYLIRLISVGRLKATMNDVEGYLTNSNIIYPLDQREKTEALAKWIKNINININKKKY